uniref:Reverse transcriptase domain-containing protein n=1 Tax=Tanacetum cinerariifolium TaxID=118510 RepID=A0A6L2LF76_TANCI|nr:reverse transcriptase domain-containing protein [Tanacetum cinerariifolium]
MSTRSAARNIFSPLDNPELTIRRISLTDPTLLNDSEMAAEGNSDLPVPDLQTMEELYQPSLNGRGGPSASIAIQATNFGLKNDMIQQVQNSCQFHGLPGDDANKNLDKFLHVTQSIKVNGVTDNALRLYLFPHSLIHHATAWFDCLPRNSINTFVQMGKMFLGKCFPPSMVTKLKNKIPNFRQRPDESLFKAWERYKLSIDQCLNHNMLPPPLATLRTYMLWEPIKFMKMNTALSLGSGTLPGNTITNPKEELKGITTRNGTVYQEPTIPTTSSSLSLLVERETKETKDMVHPTNNEITKDVQPPIFKDLNFNISFADSLILMPKFGPSIKNSLTNKDKLFELARTPLNEHFSVVLLKKLPKKLRDPDKTTPTLMSLKLADRSISRPIGVVEDVYDKVGKFHFPADFIVIDFDVDPRVPLILERSFLKTERALIDVCECELTLPKTDKSSIYEPPEVELKDLPPHLEYAFLEGDDKLPVIIAKYLSAEEKTALITVLKSHKRAIAWKHSDIKGIDPEFCTHNILMEEDIEPEVQHQRRVNPKIHDVIKNEVLKFLDAGLIYPISDSPWVSPIHRVPKKGGFTVVENEKNELIPTRLVMG